MINTSSKLFIADNSGARIVRCIKILKGSKPKYATIGDVIVVSVISTIKNSKLKKGSIYYALIIGLKKKFKRNNGIIFNFNENIAILLSKDLNLIGSRLYTSIPYEIDNIKFSKIYNLANNII